MGKPELGPEGRVGGDKRKNRRECTLSKEQPGEAREWRTQQEQKGTEAYMGLPRGAFGLESMQIYTVLNTRVIKACFSKPQEVDRGNHGFMEC